MDIEQARFNMIEQQIRPWEVLNQDVLDLLNEIHREDFIPNAYKGLAFADTRIPISHQQYTMTPKLEARLLQSLDLKKDDHVLEIGTGCGYLTALLGKSAEAVKSIDIFPDFINTAKSQLESAGLDNIRLDNCDAYSLLEKPEKFNIVVLTASLPTMDDRFMQLLNNSGKLFVITGDSPAMEARIYHKHDESSWSYESLFETDVDALIGSEVKQQFEF